MRLKSIKLAGFKSFVDPTSVNLPSNLIAIVGPNGCGKSNIIDAVRWVMGESSAKYLRGESMADVIFNGSNTRKPVAQASIELIFDECEGKLPGQFAQYAQISVMRQVTRDGQSQYFLNGSHCRRKDITDLFLGTGLGPRSYAIIMQDTVTRLIEAKPEELRVYLEEAAGISKYKERRHETELRIKHTKENLDRLNDIRSELEKQQNHLQQQAKTAERYKEYKQNERNLRIHIHTANWREHEKCFQDLQVKIEKEESELIDQQSNHAAMEANLAAKQQQLHDATQHQDVINQSYYATSAEIAKLEQRKQYTSELQQKLVEDIKQNQEKIIFFKEKLIQEQNSLVEINAQIEQLTPEIEIDEQNNVQIKQELDQAETTLQICLEQWEEFHITASKTQQKESSEATRINQLEHRIKDVQHKLNKLTQEKDAINLLDLENSIVNSSQKIQEAQENQQQAELGLQQVEARIKEQQNSYEQQQAEFNQYRVNLQKCREQIAVLSAHQQAALGQTDNAINEWLKQQNLFEIPRLGEIIKVVSGWEQAVETVLEHYIEGICVNNITEKLDSIKQVEKGNVVLIDNDYAIQTASITNRPTLADQVEANKVIKNYLRQIFIVENLESGLEIWRELNPHQSIITKDGIWLGPGWIKISKTKDQKSGVLVRQKQLKQFQDEELVLTTQVQTIEQNLQNMQNALRSFNTERDNLHQKLRDAVKLSAEVSTQHQIKVKELEQRKNNIRHIVQGIEEGNQQFETLQNELNLAQETWKTATNYLQEHETMRNQLMQNKKHHQDAVAELRVKLNNIKDQLHQKTLQMTVLTHQQSNIQNNLGLNQQQIADLSLQLDQNQQKIQELRDPLQTLTSELEQMLAKQIQIEQQLQDARQATQTLEHDLNTHNKERLQLESVAQNLRFNLEKLRMEMQNHAVRKETILEQLQEFEISLEDAQTQTPNDLTLTQLDEELQKLLRRLERLGPINLAAIEEFKEVSERKIYLDTQNADLLEALNILEDAIRKIDQETRTRFKEIFERVNQNFATIFPKIFAGGSAYLELTSQDLLETGVSVMARPAGKRNSTIHLLSGGEKALTALALVFALFQLNPAPFCLLDEVDASLDDSNVNRFCHLVKEMSQEVQCIFISHNKITIEMATHLVGVTMHEPGASRLVAVDIDKSIAMAGA